MGLTAFNRARREAEEAQASEAAAAEAEPAQEQQSEVEQAPEAEQPQELDRDALKSKADALGIEFPSNIPTVRLAVLVAEAG